MGALRSGAIAAVILAAAAATVATTAEPLPEILVTRQFASAHDLRDDDVVLLSAHADGRDPRDFRVVGIYEPTPDPMRLTAKRHEIRLHLPDLLDLTDDGTDPLHHESVGAVNVALVDPEDTVALGREVSARVPGLFWRPTAPRDDEFNPFTTLEHFHWAIAVVTMIASSMFLLALMVMRADERRETVGILRLIGWSRPRILVEVLIEGLFIAVAGAVFGVAFAKATEGIVNAFFQRHYEIALVFMRVTPGIALRCIALAVPLGVAAGLAASWTILRRDIAALVRR